MLYTGWSAVQGQPAPSEEFQPVIVPRLQESGTPSQELAVAVKDVQTFLKLEGNDEADILTAFIRSATLWVENWTRRALISRKLDLWLDRFPPGRIISLPQPPSASVEQVSWFSEADAETVIDPASYILDLIGSPARIVFKPTFSLPNTARIANAVKVQYTTGYGVDATKVPAAIKDAIKFIVAQWYEGRAVQQDSVAFATEANVPQSAMLLLSPYVVVAYDENSQASLQSGISAII